MTDKQLLEQALEALTATMSTHGFQKYIDQAKEEAITAIRARLEQPEQEQPTSADYAMGYAEGFNDGCKPAPVQEPVAIHCKAKRENHGVCPHHNLQCGWPKCNEPPVAHVQKLADCCANCLRPEHEHQEGRCPKPFTTVWHAWDYDFPPAAPVQEPVTWAGVDFAIDCFPPAQRQWVGLTDEERIEIRREHYARTLPLMDAVEAKLKEKNTP